MSERDARERDQRERARQSWELVLLERPDEPGLETLRRVLRVKRFEFDALRARLPGRLRSGARADLAPLEAALRAAGLRCALRRRDGGDGGDGSGPPADAEELSPPGRS